MNYTYCVPSLLCLKAIIEPVHEKINNLGSHQVRYKPGCTVIAGNFGFRKLSNCTIPEAITKALISFAVSAKMICAFVFAYADCYADC